MRPLRLVERLRAAGAHTPSGPPGCLLGQGDVRAYSLQLGSYLLGHVYGKSDEHDLAEDVL